MLLVDRVLVVATEMIPGDTIHLQIIGLKWKMLAIYQEEDTFRSLSMAKHMLEVEAFMILVDLADMIYTNTSRKSCTSLKRDDVIKTH